MAQLTKTFHPRGLIHHQRGTMRERANIVEIAYW